ncbi:7962_t:CDS:1 [Paraglomus brasilianum]|uniref:7962_t:CDS:1 n=1 Tax=Paraglomus brasilianum TaxID=144538 RepID=A0A9N8ZUL2_9GLOM|nr:7962_t:CDS:1 [Paraglomus brasilianum]
MATALGVSLDHTSILCTYPSDAILASRALKGIIDVGWENCLDTLLELFSHGVVEAGERGELVNCILYLKAYADVMKEYYPDSPLTYLQKVPLKSFLKFLLLQRNRWPR